MTLTTDAIVEALSAECAELRERLKGAEILTNTIRAGEAEAVRDVATAMNRVEALRVALTAIMNGTQDEWSCQQAMMALKDDAALADQPAAGATEGRADG